MKRFIWLGMLSLLIMSACGTTNEKVASVNLETIKHEVEKNGLSLEATIKKGSNIHVEASLTNVSGETIVYNGRCGVPFWISIQKENAHAHLIAPNSERNGCEDIFDPDDLRDMKPGESFEIDKTFAKKVNLDQNKTVNALSGKYEVSFSFEMHKKDTFSSMFPIELKNENEPEILTVEQAIQTAKEDGEVKEWIEGHKAKGVSVESEDAILSMGMWSVGFHAIYEDKAYRIIINMNAKSGDIQDINYEELGESVIRF
ncbi:hypothetical protein [Pontibacillus marinus]|uniref:PepSY domain-containing protein n=1 Tax=Pontibacillus marinus BH030004 = DSM 16465 TaxID=1385511 RepID=A0A0A5GDU3_9BACI|nr:hypothetical protein [Pontibacillus marinus]KGX90159.1 hypothetical protein N783_01320 [Pontibacillus marinus BH030004 = DSM 16465]